MKKSELKKIIREEIQKEIKTSPHQFHSDEEKDYQIAAAKLRKHYLDEHAVIDPSVTTFKPVECARCKRFFGQPERGAQEGTKGRRQRPRLPAGHACGRRKDCVVAGVIWMRIMLLFSPPST